MTVLVDWQIGQAVKRGTIKIEPFRAANVQPNSYDITLGDEILFDVQEGPLDPNHDDSAFMSVSTNGGSLKSLSFGLASTAETITLPNNVVAHIETKSSFARRGLSIECGGWIDAGFSGEITLELFNQGPRAIRLDEGMAIGQIVFMETAQCAKPYGVWRGSKYQYQTGPTPARFV